MANTAAPIVIIIIIALVFVPGATVPRGTPKSLIWRRKLWELHIGLLGLGLSVIAAFFITNGMKNMFGKPRPDLLSRCQPDLANLSKYIVGGIANVSSNGQLVSGDICKNPDKAFLDDGFRSYPSGHSSSSAAGLLYLSLFIASKFAITLPFIAPPGYSDASFAAFPSRLPRNNSSFRGGNRSDSGGGESYELSDRSAVRNERLAIPADPSLHTRMAMHTTAVAAVRRQAASPPLYLLGLCVLPTFGAVFIAGSRWFDFRHHGFDILFGFLIGTATAIFAFRYYHLPIAQGAGWAWGPRSRDKAFWAGIGSFSYATDRMRLDDEDDVHFVAAAAVRPGDEEEAIETVGRRGSGGGGGAGTGTGWGPGEERPVGRRPSPPAGPGEVAPGRREDVRVGTAPGQDDDRFGMAHGREESRFATAPAEEEGRFGTAY